MFKISKKILLLVILSALVIILFTGCSSEGTGKTDGSALPEKDKIIIQNYSFIPNSVTIKKGETLTWVNNDANPHIISGRGFLSNALNITDTYSYTFKEAGTFEYTCANHSEMKGQIIVK